MNNEDLAQLLLGDQANIQPPPNPLGVNQGRPVLYLPHRLFVGNNSLNEQDCPHPPSFPVFPYNRPPGLLPPLGELSSALRPLIASRYTTTPLALTKTATAVDNLDRNPAHRLVRIECCTSFWDHILRYATTNQIPNQPDHLNTWTLPVERRIPLPPPEVQAQGVKALAGWYVSHVADEEHAVGMTSEPSIQDAASVQIIQPLNHLLKTRYMTLDAGFPQWARSCPKLHLTHNKHNAGYPDYILRYSDSETQHAAIAEVKTWWTYDDDILQDLFLDVDEAGRFRWRGSSNSTKFLRQVWGELHFFRSKFGFMTNGRRILLFAKTRLGDGRNVLIMSRVRNWTDPTVLQALAGLSFAAIDTKFLDGDVLINHFLCPPADREPHWPLEGAFEP